MSREGTAVMWKKLLVLSTTAVLVGSAAYAEQRSDGRTGDVSYRFQRPSLEDLGAFTDARVAALKAGLRLTPEQDKNWPAFEQAYRNLAKLRSDRMAGLAARVAITARLRRDWERTNRSL